MLNLDHFERFCHRLTIKPRERLPGMEDTPIVPFRFNPSQNKIMLKLRERQAQRKPLWLIFLKARRLGISTFSSALLDAHCLQKPFADAMIVAQLSKTGKAMFAQCKSFADSLPMCLPEPTQYDLYFPHSGGVSKLTHATAKTVIGGRGLTLSALHMTEASRYPGEDSFVSLLNTVSRDMDNIVIIETTANGIEGPGQAYFDYWNAAVTGDNNFMPIFLPWWDDPGSRLPDYLAPDAPADEYEKWLMREFKCTKGQIAWHRQTMETLCSGSIYKWKEEYPASPDEAFISSGRPIFDDEEIEYMRQSCCDPIAKGNIMGPAKDMFFIEKRDGPLYLWEKPEPYVHYFIGVDAAKGVETGDFAAAVGWNAETGKQAFTYAARIGPEALSEVVNYLGRWYNKAMVNVELTGGWGHSTMTSLRDKFHYPNQYLWRGIRDDTPNAKSRNAFGWETTDRSRQMLFNVFRKSLRASLPRDYGDGKYIQRPEVVVRDIRLYSQATKAQTDIGFRWEVLKGHDDILMAGWLGFIALTQYHIPHPDLRVVTSTMAACEPRLPMTVQDSPETTAAGVLGMTSERHLARVMNFSRNRIDDDRLRGI